MSDYLNEVALFIDQNTSFTLGTDLIMTGVGGTPDTAVFLLDTGDTDHDYYLPSRETVMLNFMSRSRSKPTARANLREIIDLFHGRGPTVLPTVTSGIQKEFLTATCVSGPIYTSTDDTGSRHQYLASILLHIQDV